MRMVAVAMGLVLAGCADSGSRAPGAGSGSPSGTPGASAEAGTARDVLPAVQVYVDAVNRGDLDGIVRAFHPDGEIVDVSRTISGDKAIRVWARNEVVGGALRVVRIVERRADGQKLLVHWAPGGTGGFEAHYHFTVRGDRIAAANLQYAS
ncbi:hypothetical protein GCM10009804_10770 [Kribbella hippodromi]|uniref:SnoaL-like domain-containing protein n=1 Tax=Kribbella hippodromi TaxID=434347 RepID=A0ABP4N556_9ACTN